MPFWEGVHWQLTSYETLLPALPTDSEDEEEDLPNPSLHDPVWEKESLPDSMEYCCIHEIPRPATPPPYPQPAPVTPPVQPHQGVPASPPQHQVEVPQELVLMELDILDDIPDLLAMPKEVMSDFDAWAQDVLSYQF